MSTKEMLALDDLQRVIETLRARKPKIKAPPVPMDPGGKFDNVDIRKLAYEK